ncbi:MAG: VTT domain-containing protein [archaeon]|nr:VTT domain-containing protein [archaeon]MCP8306313.1 VTT domain-containing protein [archaeon]
MKKAPLIVIIVITLLLVITIVLYYLSQVLILSLDWFIGVLKGMGYVGAFVAGFLGSSSIFIAIFPSYIVVALLGGFQPNILGVLAIGILAGLGAGIGQYVHYYLGVGGRYILSEERRKSLDVWRIRLEKYGLWLILAFAMTPLTPDDIIWIPLGLIGYPKMKALLAAITGKIVLNIFYAFAGFYGWPLIEDFLKSIFP